MTNMMAVLPERMKKLANQYDSIAQPIKVAKSDPELPFKILKKYSFTADSPAKVLWDILEPQANTRWLSKPLRKLRPM